jgi:hypothetical protein
MTHRIVVNCETDETTQVEYTAEEQAAHDAAVAAQVAAEAQAVATPTETVVTPSEPTL